MAVENNVGYDRATWRYGTDTHGDCYNTRAEVLQQETRAGIIYIGCTAKTGRWLFYADNKMHKLASAVQIDHLVPLHEAHGSGGRAWTAARKKAFANDLSERRSLNAMTSTLNGSKQGSGATPDHLSDWRTHVSVPMSRNDLHESGRPAARAVHRCVVRTG